MKRIYFALILLIFSTGCEYTIFSIKVKSKSNKIGAIYQEFLHSGRLTRPIQTELHMNESVDTVSFDGFISTDAEMQQPIITIPHFSHIDGTLVIQFANPSSARMEFQHDPSFIPSNSGQNVRIVFINNWQAYQFSRVLLGFKIEDYDFYLCPSEPPKHYTSIDIHGMGKWSAYQGRVIDSKDFPFIYREKHKIYANNLNYAWSMPLDAIAIPLTYPFMYGYFFLFVRY